jgi:hypothetical protein
MATAVTSAKGRPSSLPPCSSDGQARAEVVGCLPVANRAPCAQCGQSAPIVLRGVDAFCTVCGGRRTPWASRSLNITGKPAKVGGFAARLFGWGAMIIGLFVALFLGLVVQAISVLVWPASWLGWAVAIPIALMSIVAGLVGIIGGRKLNQMGDASLKQVQLETIHGLASHRGGRVRAADAARALGVSEEMADVMLTELAKQPDENVGIDVDDDGNVTYLFGSSDAMRWRIQAERAGITDVERAELEAELEAAAAEEAARQRRA